VLAAWLAREQEAFIEYVKAENRMLKARLGRRRIIFSVTAAALCRSANLTTSRG
jgi:nitrate reductase assembly molybdenum cofactor insertion protein NarJ